jgi:hypothetical protein
VTRYRHKVFADRHLQPMEEIMRAVCVDFETELVEFNGEASHVHLPVDSPPRTAVSNRTDRPRSRSRPGAFVTTLKGGAPAPISVAGDVQSLGLGSLDEPVIERGQPCLLVQRTEQDATVRHLQMRLST